MSETTCDIRVFNSIGEGYSVGIILGALYNFPKGLILSEKGKRLKGACLLVRDKAPFFGGYIGLWGLLFNIFTCGFKRLRGKDDLNNIVYSGFAVAFCLNARSLGPKDAFYSGMWTMLFLGLIVALAKKGEKAQKQEQLAKNIDYTKSKVNSTKQI